MPFAIICPVCGYDEQGHPVTAFKDSQYDPAWIHYALHIIELHFDNFRVHWACHALDDKKIAYIKPKQLTILEQETMPNLANSGGVSARTLVKPLSSTKSNEQTITDYLLNNKQAQEDANKIIEKSKESIISKVKSKMTPKSNKSQEDDLLPESNSINKEVPQYDENNNGNNNHNNNSIDLNDPRTQAAIKRIAQSRAKNNT